MIELNEIIRNMETCYREGGCYECTKCDYLATDCIKGLIKDGADAIKALKETASGNEERVLKIQSIDKETGATRWHYKCPRCRAVVSFEVFKPSINYCWSCGQMLVWSESPESMPEILIDPSQAMICTKCKKPKPYDGYNTCYACRSRKKSYREALTKDSSMCNRCGKCPPVPGKKRCTECLKKANEVNARQRLKRVERYEKTGLCMRCGKEPSVQGVQLCTACRAKKEIYRKKEAV